MVDVRLPATEEDLMMRPLSPVPVTVHEEEPEPEPSKEEVELSEFNPQYREPFIGLLYLGSLKDSFTLYGHKFHYKTPTLREKLEAGVLHKRYVNSIAAEKAWGALTVALYLQKVDDQSLPQPIGPADDTAIEAKFNWVIDNLNDAVIGNLFERTFLLDARVAEVLQELDDGVKSSG